jgi:hypothetical protein
LTFGNKLVLRFKKFSGSRLCTSGITTAQRLEFESQQLYFDGMQVTTIVAGYLLDKLEQQVAKLAVVCPFNGANLWTIDLEIPGQSNAQVVPMGPTQQTSAPSVIIKSTQRKIDTETPGG